MKCEGFGIVFSKVFNIEPQEQVASHMCGFDGVYSREATTSKENQFKELRMT